MTNIIIWAVVLALLIVVELATAQLVTIWFAAGALVALIAASLNANVWIQLLLFGVVSGITLAATRPLVKKITNRQAEPMNADRCIGEKAVVTERIDNVAGVGAVKVGGIIWSARSSSGEVIEQDKTVEIEKIDGVKVIVKEV